MTDLTSNQATRCDEEPGSYEPPPMPYESDPDRFHRPTLRHWMIALFKWGVAIALFVLTMKFFVAFTGDASGGMPMLTPVSDTHSTRSADLNNDGRIDQFDLDLFTSMYTAGEPGADYDGDGFVTGEDFDLYNRDFNASDPGDGWTDFPLAADAREIRVDTPAALLAAKAGLVDGRPDHLLLKAGVKFPSLGRFTVGGRPGFPLLIGRYGDGPNPVIDCHGAEDGVFWEGGGGSKPAYSDIAFVGIDFVSDRLVSGPASTDPSGFKFIRAGGNITLEGCSFVGFSDNVNIQGPIGSPVRNVTIRRCVIADSFGSPQHSQGVYAAWVDGITIEESILAHNGWKDAADRDIRNHNTYLGLGVRRVRLARNLCVDASATGLSANYEATIEDNLVDGCPVGMFFRPGSTVTGNVIIGSADVSPSLPHGKGMALLSIRSDTDPVVYVGPNGPMRVAGNIIASKGPAVAGKGGAIEVSTNADGVASSVYLTDNIVFDWPCEASMLGGILVDPASPPPSSAESANPKADAIAIDGHQCAARGSPLSSWRNPGRTLDAYARSLGLKDRGEFLTRARANRIGSWDEKLTGNAARAWIAEGYGR